MTEGQAVEVMVDGRPASVQRFGRGEPMLLVHGGWGSAALHWDRVWDRLAERFEVIAPDLPGVTRGTEPGPRTVTEMARWLEHLLDALEVSSAWCVGNSFGAAVVWALAGLAPERCRGTVLVDGVPMPPSPPALQRLGRLRALRVLGRAAMRRNAYSRWTLEHGFADPDRVPPELLSVFTTPDAVQLETLLDAAIGGGPRAPAPDLPTLIVWGEQDRLIGSKVTTAHKLRDRLAGSELAVVPDAGHMPQLEQPERFVDAVVGFAEHAGAARPRPEASWAAG